MKQKESHIIVPEGCKQVLLHACCAPCSGAIVEWLLAHEIEPVIYYFNPNIYPQEEYEKRRDESKRHAESLGVKWIGGNPTLPPLKGGDFSQGEGETKYEVRSTKYEVAHQEWLKAVRGLENEPERGKRCEACFYHRLSATARKAQELGIPYFATTLASSRWKSIEQVNAAGEKAEDNVRRTDVRCTKDDGRCTKDDVRCTKDDVRCTEDDGRWTKDDGRGTKDDVRCTEVKFWAQNWRKDGLQDRRNELLKEFGFYNQQYCGCEFSIRKDASI